MNTLVSQYEVIRKVPIVGPVSRRDPTSATNPRNSTNRVFLAAYSQAIPVNRVINSIDLDMPRPYSCTL